MIIGRSTAIVEQLACVVLLPMPILRVREIAAVPKHAFVLRCVVGTGEDMLHGIFDFNDGRKIYIKQLTIRKF